MVKAIQVAQTSMNGARTATRMIIIKAFWTLLSSAVSRVTSDAVRNRSKFLNEKS